MKVTKRKGNTARQTNTDIDWRLQSQVFGSIEKDGHALAFIIQHAPDGFILMALSTPKPDGASSVDSVDAVLANHAHDCVGTFATLGQAQLAAVEYGRGWSSANDTQCACPEITKTKHARKPTKTEATTASSRSAIRRGHVRIIGA